MHIVRGILTRIAALALAVTAGLLGAAGTAHAGVADTANLRAFYNWDFPVNTVAIGPVHASSHDAFNALHTCFSCSFPVPGAPAAFPSYGQILPLRPCPGVPIGCQDATVAAYSHENDGYLLFVAEPGHFDGQGSTITFRFYSDGSGVLHLNVIAYVASQPDAARDAANQVFAQNSWSDFAHNLGDFIYLHTCPYGNCPPAPTGTVRTREYWNNPANGEAIDLNHSSPAAGTQIQIWSPNGSDAQRWNRVDYGNNNYKILSAATGKCIDVAGPSTADGAKVHEWDCYSTDSQLWNFEITGKYKNNWPIYRLRNKFSGKCLDITAFGDTDGTPLQQWSCSGGRNQEWY